MRHGSTIAWESLRVLADSSARAVFLALLVALALRVGRVRNVASRHAAWAVVLCSMLALPFLTAILPGLAMPVMPAIAMRTEPPRMRAVEPENRPIVASPPDASPSADAVIPVPSGPTTPVERVAPSPDGIPWTIWILSGYAVGVSVMLGRLALGFALCRTMIRSSDFREGTGLPHEGSCSEALRERLRRGRVAVGTTPSTSVPLTVGWLHPRILLPEGWRAWGPAKLDAALAHELAHVERRDTLLTLLGAVNLCVYWFHPLAWLLRRRLASLAEHACDDLAITWTGQRTQYARHLLEFARAMAGNRARLVPGGLSIADGGDLRTRIGAILDRHRPVARPLGRRQVAVFALAAAMIVPPLAAIRVQRRVEAAIHARAETSGPRASDKPEKDSSESRELHGRVLDPDGRPFAGAPLSVPFQDSRGHGFLSKGRSGPDGRFRFRLTRAEFKDCDYDPFRNIRVAATADGFGIGWDERPSRDGEPFKDAELTLRLVKDVPIEGRILTLEGKPVAGARVKVDRITAFPSEDMSIFIRGVRNGLEPEEDSRERNWFDPLPGRPDPITTDEQGRFHVAGLGRERLVGLDVRGPGIQSRNVLVATRKPEKEGEMALARRSNGYIIYGARFDHIANPSRPIRGVVREKGTGRPVAGVLISNFQDATEDRADTDALGRFEILGYPKSTSYSLTATPAEGQPFFTMQREVPDTAGLGPIRFDFELVRGIVVRGTLTDGETGKRIKGEVQYYPLATNPRAETLGAPRHFLPTSQSVTDADGNYAVVVLPGPGTLAVAAWGGRWDRFLAARIDREELKRVAPHAPTSNLDMFAPVAVGGPLLLSNYNELKLIGPPEGAIQPVLQDIVLRVGRTITGRVVGPDGKPMAGVRILGGTSHQFDETTSNSAGEFSIRAMDPEKKRALNLVDAGKKLGIYTEIRGDQPGPLTVRLRPCGSAFGRIVDENGQPLRNHPLVIHRQGAVGAGDYSTRTDATGAFQVEGLVPGQPYQPVDSMSRRRPPYKVFAVSPGEAKDLGEGRIQP